MASAGVVFEVNKSRVCSICGMELPLTGEFFYQNGGGRFRSSCKQCEATRHAAFYRTNRDAVREYSRDYYQSKRAEIHEQRRQSKRKKESKEG